MSAGTVSLDATRALVRRDFAVVPVPRGAKAPRIPGWPSLRLNEADLPSHFSDGANVGVILGAPSGGLIDIDLDSPEALAVADFFLPPSDFVFGRASKPRSHRFYVCERNNPLSRPKPQKFCAPDGGTLVELRADGQQTVLPPSLHPSGEFYTFERDGQPASVDGPAILRAVALIAAAALVARNWPAEGRRHEAALALSGMLLRGGFSAEQAARFMEAVALAAGDEELRGRVRDVCSTASRLGAGGTATGAPTLAGIVGDDIVARVREWLNSGVIRPIETNGTDWPDPAPLGDELPAVPVFDPELLPVSFRPLIEDVSERMQTPPDYAAAATLVVLAGCVNRRAVIVPKLADKSWKVVPNLWGAIIAPPGMMKSPILRAVTLPLVQIEERWRAEFESAIAGFELEKEKAELRRQGWREEFKRAAKKGGAEPVLADQNLSKPMQKRLILTDATFEKLHEILAENPSGVLVVRDELTGWLSELGRLGREGERAFFLQAWNGDSGFTVDRIGRGSIYVPAVCVSLLGNIQPARLRSYLSEANDGPTDDGLFQRFQIMTWPDLPQAWKLVDRPANDGALRVVEKVFSALVQLSPDTPVVLRFASDSQLLFFDWWAELEAKIRGGLAPVLAAHLSKYRSLMPTLAGIFELAERAASGDNLDCETKISIEHAKKAAALCDYLEAHARRVYSCAVSPERRAARELAEHIAAGDLPSPFTTRAAYLKGWTGLDTPERARCALLFLADANWVSRSENQPSTLGGRPSEMWHINPKVRRGHA
jgi:hypothetical protein